MKNKLLINVQSKIIFALLAAFSLAPRSDVQAQTLQLPSTPNSVFFPMNHLPWGLNTAAIAYSNYGNYLFCGVASCGAGGGTGMNMIQVNDYVSGLSAFIASPPMVYSAPDVILGNSDYTGGRSPLNDFILATSYTDIFGNGRIDFYDVHVAPLITISPIPGGITIPSGSGVQIDVIADFSNTSVTGYPYCGRFMVSWSDGTNINVAEYDINSQALISGPVVVGSGGSSDVAGIERGTYFSNNDWALIAYTDFSGNLNYSEWMAGSASASVPIVLDATNPMGPRIDAFDNFSMNTMPGVSEYKVVAQAFNSILGVWETRTYDNLLYPGYWSSSLVDDLTPGGFPTPPYHSFHPCVSVWGPFAYSVLHVDSPLPTWWTGGDALVTEPINYMSPTTLWANTYYKVNDVGGTGYNAAYSDRYCSVSDAPNTFQSFFEVFAWSLYLGPIYQIDYKVSAGAPPAFKHSQPSNGVANVTAQQWSAYPNPATSQLTIQNGQGNTATDYGIVDMAGRFVLQGKIAGSTYTIDVSSLVSGNYILKVYDRDNETGTMTFVKK